jgi:hypothetical protein
MSATAIEQRHQHVAYGTVPHLPAPRSTPIVAAVPTAAAVPLRIGISPLHAKGLLAYQAGERHRAALFAIKAVVNQCAAGVSGKGTVMKNGHSAIVMLTPCLQATLLAMFGRTWSDAAYEAVWAKLEKRIYPG